MERNRPPNFQERLCIAIDSALAKRPASLEEFLDLMKQAGYEVKKVRGGGLSFRLPGGGQERFTRLRASTLGEGYDLKVFFVKYFSLKKASEFPFFSKGFSLPSAGIMHPCA